MVSSMSMPKGETSRFTRAGEWAFGGLTLLGLTALGIAYYLYVSSAEGAAQYSALFAGVLVVLGGLMLGWSFFRQGEDFLDKLLSGAGQAVLLGAILSFGFSVTGQFAEEERIERERQRDQRLASEQDEREQQLADEAERRAIAAAIRQDAGGKTFPDVDVQGQNLSGLELSGYNLDGADLRGANLEYADLKGASLRGADLRGARLYFASLELTDLREAQLQGAVIGNADFTSSNLEGAMMAGTVFFPPDERTGEEIPELAPVVGWETASCDETTVLPDGVSRTGAATCGQINSW
jgi:uncharacterized protein YjbI with pentapeptide repeats